MIDNNDLCDILIDVLSIIDMETAMTAGDKKDDRERFLNLLKEAEKFLPEGTLKERMDVDSLGEVGILKAPRKFFSAVIKLKTKLL